MKVKASDFASDKDLRAYRLAKQRGLSDQEAFALGDNGIGYWGDNTNKSDEPMCALPPDDMIAVWGSLPKARHQLVAVTINGKTVICKVADRMPWKRNIKNGAGIDLNPKALSAFKLTSPIMVDAEWVRHDKETTTPTPTKATKSFWQRLLFWRK